MSRFGSVPVVPSVHVRLPRAEEALCGYRGKAFVEWTQVELVQDRNAPSTSCANCASAVRRVNRDADLRRSQRSAGPGRPSSRPA